MSCFSFKSEGDQPPGWGLLNLKRVWGCAAGKTPFSCSLSHTARPPFQHFLLPQDPPFKQKITLKFPNFLYKMPKFGKFSVFKPKIWPKSS